MKINPSKTSQNGRSMNGSPNTGDDAMSKKLILAAGYIRMSTDQQADSPDRQKMEIIALAKRDGYKIVVWYEDLGMTGTESAKRRGFQSLLADCTGGTFSVVLVYEQSRLSREKVLDAMMHWQVLSKAGVGVVTCQRGALDFESLGGLIMLMVDQHGAHDESVKLAGRSVSGKMYKIRRGELMNGKVFGYDREFTDESGAIVQRVHFGKRFARPKEWKTRLVISHDKMAVELVRSAFQMTRAGQPQTAVLHKFRRAGQKNLRGGQFHLSTITRMLRNPIYAGTLEFGKLSCGKFAQLERTTIKNAHDPLVNPKLFYEVQDILDGRKVFRQKPVEGRYLLGKVLYCFHCGGPMYGHCGVNGSGERALSYRCDRARVGADPSCSHQIFYAEPLERFLLETIRRFVLTDADNPNIERAEGQAATKPAPERTSFESQVRDLEGKIGKATENLALADKQDMPGIGKLIHGWREDCRKLQAKIEALDQMKPADPTALKVSKILATARGQLSDANRSILSHAVSRTVKHMTIGRETIKGCGVTFRRTIGFLEFRDGVGVARPIPVDDDVLYPNRRYKAVAEFVKMRDEPTRLIDVMKSFDIGSTAASRHLRHAQADGRIKRAGTHRFSGWCA